MNNNDNTISANYDDGQGNLITELEQFYNGITKYKELVISKKKDEIKNIQEPELESLRTQLEREYGSLNNIIEKYGGPSIVLLQSGNYKCEAFKDMFNYNLFAPSTFVVVIDTAIRTLNMAIGKLKQLQKSEVISPSKNVFENGRQYDAYISIKNRITTATKKLIIVDPWVNSDLFKLLENTQQGVQIQILTTNCLGDFSLTAEKFKKQIQQDKQIKMDVRKSNRFHDRFLIIDDKVFHLGASIKDAGNKMSVMQEIIGVEFKTDITKIVLNYWDSAEVIM